MKKVKKDFCGVCELRQLPINVFFRICYNDGGVSKETYFIDYYDKSLKKYQCSKCSDPWGNGRVLKGSQFVTTDFIY